jgi:hypothetical protein
LLHALIVFTELLPGNALIKSVSDKKFKVSNNKIKMKRKMQDSLCKCEMPYERFPKQFTAMHCPYWIH